MKNEENIQKSGKIAAIMYSYNVLRMKNAVKSQKDFANLLGVNEQTISSALRGRDGYLTDNLMRKISAYMQREYGIDIYNASDITIASGNNVGGDQKILGGGDVEAVVDKLTEEMRLQREQYAAQFERLLNMLEREQSRTEELLKRLQQ